MSTIKHHHQSAMFYRGNCLGSPHTGYGPELIPDEVRAAAKIKTKRIVTCFVV